MTSSDDDVITLQIEGSMNSRNVQMHFEVEKSECLQAVLHKYSKFKGTSLDSLQFTHKKKTIQQNDSPASLGITDADNTIQVSLIGKALTNEQLSQACTSGSISSVINLISENKECISDRLSWFDSDGQELSTPPIFICIDYGHVDLVEELLPLHNEGILNTLRDGDGEYSPLCWASWTGNLDIVKILVEKGGANVDEEALSLAREHDHNEVAIFLLKHVDLYSNLEGDLDATMEKACREGDLIKVQELLEKKNYDIAKWKDDDGKILAFSPIHLAMKNGHMELIRLFGEKGVQMDLLESAPKTAKDFLDAVPKL